MSSIDICAICQNDIDYKKSVLTSCNHYFCSTCFFRWMEKKADCPVCRKVFRDKTNYDIEVERDILEQLEYEVRDYTNLVEELREQAFNMEYKKNTLVKTCFNLDENIKIKKTEFNNIVNEINSLVSRRNTVKNDIDKGYKYMKKMEEGFKRAKKRRAFGLNFN
jgi:hypothetical protein